MSWKDEYIAKYGEEAYARHLIHGRKWRKKNLEMTREMIKGWTGRNSEKVIEYGRQRCRKGGEYYERALEYQRTGLRRERNKIRRKHGDMWRLYKRIIAPGSVLHHQWQPDSAEYDGVALVEEDKHQHGIIDVIQILEGEITLFTEEFLRRGVASDAKNCS